MICNKYEYIGNKYIRFLVLMYNLNTEKCFTRFIKEFVFKHKIKFPSISCILGDVYLLIKKRTWHFDSIC